MKRTLMLLVGLLSFGIMLSGCAPPKTTPTQVGEPTTQTDTNNNPTEENLKEESPEKPPDEIVSEATTVKNAVEEQIDWSSYKQSFNKSLALRDQVLTVSLEAFPTLPDWLINELTTYADEHSLDLELQQNNSTISLTYTSEDILEHYTPLDTIISSYQPEITLPDFFVHQDNYWNEERPDLFDKELPFWGQERDSIYDHFQEVDRYMDEMRRQMFQFMDTEFQDTDIHLSLDPPEILPTEE